ncbi:MAG: TetR/AcrR family transcriptional regulator [Eubacterium sp.]|nr:TetR/AcrR family transcriptional regulator [Eubacterium sp.]
MAEKKVDRRTLKTQRAIKEALAELIAEKEIRHITVQELSDLADVHRVTFYKHYYDIYDVYEQLEREILSDLGVLILDFHKRPVEDFDLQLVDYIADNPKIFKMIFSPHNTGELKHKFSNMVDGVFRLIQYEKNGIDFKDSRLDYLAACWSSSSIEVLSKWVQSDFAQPKEFIFKILLEVDEHLEKLLLV